MAINEGKVARSDAPVGGVERSNRDLPRAARNRSALFGELEVVIGLPQYKSLLPSDVAQVVLRARQLSERLFALQCGLVAALDRHADADDRVELLSIRTAGTQSADRTVLRSRHRQRRIRQLACDRHVSLGTVDRGSGDRDVHVVGDELVLSALQRDRVRGCRDYSQQRDGRYKKICGAQPRR